MTIPLTKDGKPDKRYKNNIPIITDDLLDGTRQKIDIHKAFTLRIKNKLSYQQIADQLGVSKQAVHERLTSILNIINDPQTTDLYQQNKAYIAESVQAKYLLSLLDDDKLKKATANNIAYTISQLDSMIRLERGQSTQNISYQNITGSIEELTNKLSQLQAEMGKL